MCEPVCLSVTVPCVGFVCGLDMVTDERCCLTETVRLRDTLDGTCSAQWLARSGVQQFAVLLPITPPSAARGALRERSVGSGQQTGKAGFTAGPPASI